MTMFSTQTRAKMLRLKLAYGKTSLDKQFNLVARVLPTEQGKYLQAQTTAGPVALGAKGAGAEVPYEIREAAKWAQGPFRLYCSCPDQLHGKGFGRPCKHIEMLMLEYPEFQAKDLMFTEREDLIIYDPEAVERAIQVMLDRTKPLVDDGKDPLEGVLD